MFAPRYFAEHYFAGRYFAQGQLGGATDAPLAGTSAGVATAAGAAIAVLRVVTPPAGSGRWWLTRSRRPKQPARILRVAGVADGGSGALGRVSAIASLGGAAWGGSAASGGAVLGRGVLLGGAAESHATAMAAGSLAWSRHGAAIARLAEAARQAAELGEMEDMMLALLAA